MIKWEKSIKSGLKIKRSKRVDLISNSNIVRKGVITIELENVEEKIKQIKLLMRTLENDPDIYKIQELNAILNEIGTQRALYAKYKTIFDAAAEVLISASIDAKAQKCDPTQRRLPE